MTDTAARKAKAKDRDYKLYDALGLFLLVRANGSKLWRCRYRFADKERVLSFGPYPGVSLAQARAKREAALAQLREGMDPSIERKRDKIKSRVTAEQTFEAVSRRWYELQRGRWTETHSADVIRSLERDVFPALGGLPITMIDAPILLDTLRKVEARGSIETAHRLRQRVGAIFDMAESEAITVANPAKVIVKALKPMPKKKRQPAITEIEPLRELLATVEGSGAYPLTLYASRFLALTAQRPGTVRRARWEDMRLHGPEPVWHIPAEQMKLDLDKKGEAAFDHVVPLAPAAVETLQAAAQLSGNCKLVFPGQRHAHIPLSENAIGYLYNRCGYQGRHVPHGWRAAFSTIMNEWAKHEGRADDRAVIDLMLAHVPENKVEAAYNRAEFMPRRRELAERWAAMLMEGAPPADDLLSLARRVR